MHVGTVRRPSAPSTTTGSATLFQSQTKVVIVLSGTFPSSQLFPRHLLGSSRSKVLQWFSELCKAYLGDSLIRRHATVGKHVRVLVPFFEYLFTNDLMEIGGRLATSANVESYVPPMFEFVNATTSRRNKIVTLLGALSTFQQWELSHRGMHETTIEVRRVC